MTLLSTTLYQALKAAGCEIDSHCSDLYVRDTVRARDIIAEFPEHIRELRFFVSPVDNRPWLEIPFAYDPYWNARQRSDDSLDRYIENEFKKLQEDRKKKS